MKLKLTFNSLLLVALLLALTRTSPASTTWYVDGVHGSDGNNCKSPGTACKTIGHAISLASSGDSIMVTAATYTENLTIGISLSVLGSGASATIIDRGGRFGTVVTTTATVVLSGLTIRNGNTGGVYNAGILTITHSTISGNSAYGAGGGIYNGGTLTINNSTISGNVVMGECGGRPPSCAGGTGGGIFSSGTLTINDSTVSGNVAETPACLFPICGGSRGGGIYNGGGKLTINNSTFGGNSATGSCFQHRCIYGLGGGIAAGSTVKIQNSIVANNSFLNCYGTMTSNGYNMSSDSSCGFSNSGDRNNTDPKLGPLQNNGGQTQTMALLPGSPAIDAGNPSGCKDGNGRLLTTDQRGMPRPDTEDKTGCDMGAYERQVD